MLKIIFCPTHDFNDLIIMIFIILHVKNGKTSTVKEKIS